jgi:hypothetical protein
VLFKVPVTHLALYNPEMDAVVEPGAANAMSADVRASDAFEIRGGVKGSHHIYERG